MAFNFWKAQRRARSWTWLYLFVFLFITLTISILIEVVTYSLAKEGYITPMPYLGVVFLGGTLLIAFIFYLSYSSSGGTVAEALGGKKVTVNSSTFQEQKLINIVQEMAIASGQPMPTVYILPAGEINAFAAGLKPEKAAIAVTQGALDALSRDELQGVIAHEFGHIYNADMKINMRLAAMVMGFMFVFYLGVRLVEGSLLFGGRGNRRGGGIALAALILMLAGLITWFAGVLLRAMVSRQREYLADACSVQFTRNPDGIASALRKISKQKKSDMPRSGMAYSHLYFNNSSFWGKLFATHPPIEKRIAAIENRTYVPDEWKTK